MHINTCSAFTKDSSAAVMKISGAYVKFGAIDLTGIKKLELIPAPARNPLTGVGIPLGVSQVKFNTLP